MSHDEIISRVEEAGVTLLSMGIARPHPSSRVVAALPIVHEEQQSYGWSQASVRPAIPDSQAISRMDEALSWMEAIPKEDYVLRRIVGARSLVSPLNGHYLFSWRKLAKMLGADGRAVKRWHADGIRLIVAWLREPDVKRHRV